MWVNRRLNGNFDLLKTLIEDGKITGSVVKSFPLKKLTEPQNFISLLHYFGLVSIAGRRLKEVVLAIPNRSVAELIYGYLRAAYEEANIFRIDINPKAMWICFYRPLMTSTPKCIRALSLS